MSVTVGHVLTVGPDSAGGLQLARWEAPSTDATAPVIFHPVGKHAIDEELATLAGGTWNTTETVEVTRAIYLGRAMKAFVAAKVVHEVLTAGVLLDWAELAICSGTPNPYGATSLTLIGYTDTSTLWTAVGVKAPTIVAAIPKGTHLWLAWGHDTDVNLGGTKPEFRAFQKDAMKCGLTVEAAARPSTMSADTAFSLIDDRSMCSLVGAT